MSSNNPEFLSAALRRAERRLRASVRLPDLPAGPRPKTAAAAVNFVNRPSITGENGSSLLSQSQPRPPRANRPNSSRFSASPRRPATRGSARDQSFMQSHRPSTAMSGSGLDSLPHAVLEIARNKRAAHEPISRSKSPLRATAEVSNVTESSAEATHAALRTPLPRPMSPMMPFDQLQGRVERWTKCQAPRPANVTQVLGAAMVGWGGARVVAVLVADPPVPASRPSGSRLPLSEGEMPASLVHNIRLLTYNLKLQQWRAPDIEGEVPPVLRNAAVCSWRVIRDTPAFAPYRRISKLLLYGGQDGEGKCTDAVYLLTAAEDIPTPRDMLPHRQVAWRWSRVEKAPDCEAPSPRAFHAMCCHENMAYVHGGMLSDGSLSAEFWELAVSGDAYASTARWRRLASGDASMNQMSCASPPRPRRKHTLCCHGEKLFLFGGEGDEPRVAGELFSYHCSRETWEALSGVRDGCIRQGTLRNSHSGCACGPLVIAVGGKILGHCETTKEKISFGVRLLDTRDDLPAYSASMPADVDPRQFETGSQLVSVSTNSFLLISGDCSLCYEGEISVMDSPSVEACTFSTSGTAGKLKLRTRGMPASVDELLVRIEHPMLTLTAIAEKLVPERKTYAELNQRLISNGRRQPQDREPLPRDLNFRPSLQMHDWELQVPGIPELIDRAGLAEGAMAVEIAIGQDTGQATIFSTDGHEFLSQCQLPEWQALYIEQGGASSGIVAGSEFNVMLLEQVIVPSGVLDQVAIRASEDDQVVFTDDELLQTSELYPARVAMKASLSGDVPTSSSVPNGRCIFEARNAPISDHRRVRMAPKIWLTEGMVWTLSIHPDEPGGGHVAFSGALKSDANRRFAISRVLKELGTYELVVRRAPTKTRDGDLMPGDVVPLIDWKGNIVHQLRFEVYPGAVTRRTANLSCPEKVPNGRVLHVRVDLEGSDEQGNLGLVEPGLCFLEMISDPTGQYAARVPLDPKGGQSQTVDVCILERALTAKAGAWQLLKWALDNGVDLSECISLLRMQLRYYNELGEVQLLGVLQSPSSVKVQPFASEMCLNVNELDAERLGLTTKYVRSLPDCGAAAFKATAKLRDEMRLGLVTCTSTGNADGNEPAPLTRYFHVINVHISGGEEGEHVLMELARIYKGSPLQVVRVGVLSRKFRPAHRMRSELEETTYVEAAREAVFRALNLKKGLHVECNRLTYRTEHVYARSKIIPSMNSIYIVHHVGVTVRPISDHDFFVKHPAYDSFFVWQPRILVDELLSDRRQALLDEFARANDSPDLGKYPAASWLVINFRVSGNGQEEISARDYLALNDRLLYSRCTPHTPQENLEHREQTLRKICNALFLGATKLTLQVVTGSLTGVVRMTATFSGELLSGASLLLFGPHEELRTRAETFMRIAEQLEQNGDTTEQMIGLGRPVRGDKCISGACAPIRGGIWEMPEFAHCGLALSLTPLSQSYSTMLAGDPKRCVHHTKMATASLSNIAATMQEEYPEINLDNIAELTELIAKSFKVYDAELDKLYKKDPQNTEALLAVQDEELWQARREEYPLANGKSKLCQPSLGFEKTWQHDEEDKAKRHRNLIEQAKATQLAVKNRLLRSPMPLSDVEMEMKWPRMSRLAGIDMLPWGCGEAFDPGTKSAGRLMEKAEVKYQGNVALLKDVSRFSIYYPDSETLFAGLQALRQAFTVVKIENRFRNPTVLGWRDVTVVVEETLTGHEWGPDGARHLCEIQLQLNGYTVAREHAHHYYELVRKKIVTDSNVLDTDLQNRLLLTLLSAIVGESASVSGSLLKNNHIVLSEVFSATFGELWSAATCRLRHHPDDAVASSWSLARDIVGETPEAPSSPVGSPTTGVGAGTREQGKRTRPARAVQHAQEKTLVRAARLITKASKHNLVIRAVVDSCLKKLGVGSWEEFSGKDIQAAATKLLGAEPMTRRRAAPDHHSNNAILLGTGHDNLRLCDLLVGLNGQVWCSVVDGVYDKQCSFSPILHEVHVTHGNLQLVSLTDLMEAFQLSNELADLDFTLADEAALNSFREPPACLKTHILRQSYCAAATLRHYAWLYAGSGAIESGEVLDLVNLQHAGVLASRYLLSNDFLRKSSANTAWAFLAMAVNYDRASGPSQADPVDPILAISPDVAVDIEQMLHALKAYNATMATRVFLRPDPITGERLCDDPPDEEILAQLAFLSDLSSDGFGMSCRLAVQYASSIEEFHGGGATKEREDNEPGAEGKATMSKSTKVMAKSHLRLPGAQLKGQADNDSYNQLSAAYCERVRVQTTTVHDCHMQNGELGIGAMGRDIDTSDMMINLREKGAHALALSMDLSTWISNEVERLNVEPTVGPMKTQIIVMCGTWLGERGDEVYGKAEQARLNSYVCSKVMHLASIYKTAEGKSFVPIKVDPHDFERAVDKMAISEQKGMKNRDLLSHVWGERFSPVDRRRRFMQEVQNRGELLVIVEGVLSSHSILAEHLPSLRGVAMVLLTHESGEGGPEPLPGDLGQSARHYDVLHTGKPSFLWPHHSGIKDSHDICAEESISFVMTDLSAIRLELEVHPVLNERHVKCSSFFIRMREKERRDEQGNLRGGTWIREIHIDALDLKGMQEGDVLPDGAVESRKISCTFDGLEEDTEYEFSACGVNWLGIGLWSDPQSCRTSSTPRELGVVGAVELLTERFRPPASHFTEVFNTADSLKPKHNATFEELNKQVEIPSFFAQPIPEDELPGELCDGWSHAGHFASVCMSTTLADEAGVKAFGADNVLKNKACFVKKYGQIDSDLRDVKFPEDFRPRDGSSASWISLSGTSKGASRGASSTFHETEHVIQHEMGTCHLASAAAVVIGEESGTTHAQASTDLDDDTPFFFLTFPVGCLIEEIHIIDGYPPMPNNANRVTSLLVDVFHLDQQELLSRGDFKSLTNVLEKKRSVWSGQATKSGVHTSVINLKEWAADRKKDYEERTGRPYHKVGGVCFSGDVMGIAELPTDEQRGEAIQATGAVGNIIRVSWAPDRDGRPFVNNPPLPAPHIRFALGGLVVVGRRIQEPLWRGSVQFLKQVATKTMNQRLDVAKRQGAMLVRQITMQAMERPELHRSDLPPAKIEAEPIPEEDGDGNRP